MDRGTPQTHPSEAYVDVEGILRKRTEDLEAQVERLKRAAHGVLQADRNLSRPFPNRNNRELYQAIDELQLAVEGEQDG